MAADNELRGVIPIVYTPFDERGEIDEEDLRRLVDYLIASGVHGLAAVGTASESQKMTMAERNWLARVTVEQAAGRVPVIVGTSAENTKTAVELSVQAEQAGAVAVYLTPPSYGPLTPGAIRAHYAAVARVVSIPIVVQHHLIPIAVRQMVDLADEFPTIRYVKEEAPDVSSHCISELLRLSQGRLRVFSSAVYFPDELARGVVGAVPGSVCVADLVRAYELFGKGDEQGARSAFTHALPLLYARRPNPVLWAKEVLRRQGVFKAAYLREPAGEGLDEHDLREIGAIMDLMGPPY